MEEGALSNIEMYIREARSKFIQYKIIYRYYYTPRRLNKMKLMGEDLCWKCRKQCGIFMHFFKYSVIFHSCLVL